MGYGEEWDAQKILDIYLHDYMVKKKMHKTAQIFAKQCNIPPDPVALDPPNGFLTEWWSVFWDVYCSRVQVHPGAKEESSSQATRMGQQNTGQLPIGMDLDEMMGQPAAGLLAAKIYEEECLRRLAKGFDPNDRLLDVDKLALSNPSSSSASHSHQKSSRMAPPRVARYIRCGIPTDSTLYGVPNGLSPRTGVHDSGMNKWVDPMPLEGWPLTGVDQITPPLGYQVLNSLLPLPSELQNFQLPAGQYQQDFLAQLMAQTIWKPQSSFPGSSSNLGCGILSRSEVRDKDEQMTIPTRQTTEQKRMTRMTQAEQPQKDQLKQHKLYEDQCSRKRKSSSHSQPEDNAWDDKDAEADKALDENVESFLSHDGENDDITSTLFSPLRRRSTASNNYESKGFSFDELYCLNSSKSKVLCCHFSSDGKLLASAGHAKKVAIWNMDTLDFFDIAESHSHIITDVRFRPNTTVFASSSFDNTVKIWDATKSRKSLFKLIGHTEQVMSLDFHPRMTDLLCSCDSNDEIRLWNIRQCACARTFKGATRQVRFQPRFGKLLAAASGNDISLFDLESKNFLQFHLEGHVKEVRSLCWDTSGKYIASVSEDSARVWSTVSGGKCIYELHSNGNKFESCTFHPGYSQLLVIGSYQTLQLWNPTVNNKTLAFGAHNGIISSLANSPQTEMIASASHDQLVKLWK